MAAKLVLVKKNAPPVNQETIRELEELLRLAKEGLLPGFAGIAFHIEGDFTVIATGRARFQPVYARGALQSLDSLLSALIS